MITDWDVTDLPSARLLGTFVSGSPEWHELRSQGVGGSQVGTVLGLNPWESAFTLWAKACGLIEDRESSLAMRAGSFFERPIKEFWLLENPGFEILETGTWQSKVHEFAHANPDGILRASDGSLSILEIKTSRYPWNEIPPHYKAQVLWYMAVLGIPKGKLVAWVSGSEFHEYDIEWDQFEAEAQFATVKRWWDCVGSGEQPEWDGSTSTYETVKLLHPNIDPDGVVDLGELGVALVNAQSDADAAQALLTELKSRTLDAMGDAKTAVVDDHVVATRSARNGGTPFLTIKK